MLPPPPRPTLFPYTTLFRSPPLHHQPAELHEELLQGGQVDRRPAADALEGRVQLGLFHQPSRQRAVERRRSEEHTSELQSRVDLVCRLLLEKKKHRL